MIAYKTTLTTTSQPDITDLKIEVQRLKDRVREIDEQIKAIKPTIESLEFAHWSNRRLP